MANDRSDRGDGRDANGRYVKGKCGNLSGRPRDVPDLDMADVYNFSQVATEITVAGEKKLMTRHEIILLKLYESALKGRITSIRLLLEKFEQADLAKEKIQWNLQKWVEIMAEDPDLVPPDAEYWIKMVLNHSGPRPSKIRTRSGGRQEPE